MERLKLLELLYPLARALCFAAARAVASGVALALGAALPLGIGLAVAGAGCRDRPAFESVVPGPIPDALTDDTALERLTFPATLTASSALVSPSAVVAVPFFRSLQRDFTNLSDEFLEGTIFLADVTSTAGPGAGMVRQILDPAVPTGTAASVQDYFAFDEAAPRGLAIDRVEAGGRIGRLWVAAGRAFHVLSGRDGSSADPDLRPRELAAISLTADLLPEGETLISLVAAPPGLQLFAASARRIFRIDPAEDPAASTIRLFFEFPGAGETIGLACGADGTLFVGRSEAGAIVFYRLEKSLFLESLPVAAIAPYPVSPTLAALRGMTANSLSRLVVAGSTGTAVPVFVEYGASGAAVTLNAAAYASALGPVFADPFISRLLFTSVPASPGPLEVGELLNVSLSGGVQTVFDNRCAACHDSEFANGDLVLARGSSRAQLVFVRACETTSAPCTGLFSCPAGCPHPEPLDRVSAGDPAASYLVRKLEAAQGSTEACSSQVCGERMPQASYVREPLRRAEVEIVREWIRRGAPDD